MDIENEFFIKLYDYPVIICKGCHVGVRPQHIKAHLHGPRHRKPLALCREMQATVQQWDGVQECADWELPRKMVNPIPHIPVRTNGILCRLDPQCSYVVANKKVMKIHWREVHAHCWPKRRGRRRHDTTDANGHEFEDLSAKVAYQHVFISGSGSRYVWIESIDVEAEGPGPVHQASQIRAALDEMEELYHQHIHQPIRIEGDQQDEASPWLHQTRWTVYLWDLDPLDLVQCVQQPVPEDRSEEALTTAAIWASMAAVVRMSQKLCADVRIGRNILMDAARVERHKAPAHPLRPTMDENAIAQHCASWQQVLMFFARTQVTHHWRSPRYCFTPQQQAAWEKLWHEARGVALSDEFASPVRTPSSVPRLKSEDTSSEDEHAGRDSEWELSPIDTACLNFCMELLNQRSRAADYESALVCAVAVQGRGEASWRDANSYAPILSRIIKVARFILVHKAMRLAPEGVAIIKTLPECGMAGTGVGESASYSDAFQSTGAGQATWIQFSQSSPTGSFRDWVSGMVDKFMVRGTHSPIQWMLDVRLYAMTTCLNSTVPDHVTWMDPDRLCYKELTFTMRDFKSYVHQVVNDTRKTLLVDLMLTDMTEVPEIPWKTLYDNPTKRGDGWSFLQDVRTPWPVDGTQWMQQRLRSVPRIGEMFFQDGAPRMTQIDSYMRRVVEFRRSLCIAIHICGGRPFRSLELLGIRHRNTDNCQRNVFIQNGMVLIDTAYYNGSYASDDGKTIQRYLPREIGELVVWYLWLVLPFVQRLELYLDRLRGTSRDEANKQAAYMWPPDPNTQRKWGSDRLREGLKRETRRALDAAIDLAAYRDIAIGISRRYLRCSSQFPNNIRTDDRNPEDQDDIEDEADMMDEECAGYADLQAANSTHVAGMTCEFEGMGHRSYMAQRRHLFLSSSTDWHSFLGFACGDSAPLHPRIRSPPRRASPDFRPASSTTFSAVQLGKRPAADQPEERTPQRARITKRVIRDLEGQEQERQKSLISSQQSEQTQQPMGSEEHFLEEQVARWALRCFLCQQSGRSHHHTLSRCSEPRHREARQWMLEVRKEIQNHWDKYCGCYQCGLPQTICKTFQAGEPCKYGSVIISAIAMMAFGPRPPQSIAERVRKAWERRLQEEHGVWIGDREALARHLGSKNGNEEVFTLVAEFLWLLWAWRSRGKEFK
ncbi:hypothetical protein N7461_007866 [Penicillium sp. DV-2018c]|nr:hypothetical protein N7461_007866 [Penicillium sp. DV-2018c]